MQNKGYNWGTFVDLGLIALIFLLILSLSKHFIPTISYREDILHDMTKEKDNVRKAHKKNAETASDTSFKDFFLQRLDAVSCYDEDLSKSFIALTCKVHDIPLSALSQEQKEVLRSIMLKSRKYQAAVKQRKNSKKKKIGARK